MNGYSPNVTEETLGVWTYIPHGWKCQSCARQSLTLSTNSILVVLNFDLGEWLTNAAMRIEVLSRSFAVNTS